MVCIPKQFAYEVGIIWQPPVFVSEDLGLILYCSSSGELTSARVAVALRKKGISNVWVLE
jgi:hypothetical protein